MVIPLMSELLEQTENYNPWNNHERPAASSSVLLFVFDTNWFNLIEKKCSRSYRSNKSFFIIAKYIVFRCAWYLFGSYTKIEDWIANADFCQ